MITLFVILLFGGLMFFAGYRYAKSNEADKKKIDEANKINDARNGTQQ